MMTRDQYRKLVVKARYTIQSKNLDVDKTPHEVKVHILKMAKLRGKRKNLQIVFDNYNHYSKRAIEFY